MARSTMEVAFLGTQMTQVEDTKYAKVFYGDEPDGKTEHGLSIIGMAIAEDAADEVFAAGAQFAPLELVRIPSTWLAAARTRARIWPCTSKR
jgi:hypothetical protein